MTNQQILEVVSAAEAGKRIEWRHKEQRGQAWNPADNPVWDFCHNEYRVAPEPREWWIDEANHAWDSPQSIGLNIHVREVL